VKEFIKEVTANVQNPPYIYIYIYIYIYNMGQNQNGTNEAAGKIIGKEERSQRNSWF